MKRYLFILFLGTCFLFSCSKEDMELKMADGIDTSIRSTSIKLTKAQSDLTATTNVFAFNLFNQVRSSRKEETLLLSPFSAAMALGMAATGAQGETELQMRSVLGFEDVTKEEMAEYYSKMLSGLAKADPYVDLRIANSIWIDKYFPVKEDFIKNSEKSFDSIAENRDFSASATLKEINDWVSEKTDGTIKDLLERLDPDARVALVNALCFEGKWRYAFAGSKKGQFKNVSGGKTRTDMMYATGEIFYSNKDGWEMVRLPYGTEAFSMYIILPPEGEKFQSTTLDYNIWQSLNIGGASRLCEVNMNIPSFISNDSHDLIDPLKALGMALPFKDGADFSAMTDTDVRIGKVDQKTYIEVNEKGTKASSATVVVHRYGATGTSMEGEVKLESVNFDADRPFYYVISEKSTNALLFIGQVTNL